MNVTLKGSRRFECNHNFRMAGSIPGSFALDLLVLCSILGHSHGISDISQDKGLQQQLDSCKFGETSGIVTDDNALKSEVYEWSKQSEMPANYFHFREKNEGYERLQSWIRVNYVENGITDFVVNVHNPGHVLERVDFIFKNESTGKLAALPHRSRWLIFVQTTRQLKQIRDQQTGSFLDNVAVVYVKTEQLSKHLRINQTHTFMWGENRTKRWHSVSSNITGGSCAIFPNAKLGLNKRQLKVIAKAKWRPNLRTWRNPKTGTLEYTGSLARAIQALSQLMNFTYIIWPPPCQMMSIEWPNFRLHLTNGSFDIGLTSMDAYRIRRYPDLEVSFELSSDCATGIYRKPVRFCSFLTLNQCNISLYKWVVLLYTVALLITTTLYFIIVHVAFSTTASGEDTESNMSDCTGRDGSVKLNCFRRQRINGYFNSLIYFTSSSLNQGNLPEVKFVSARILIGSWGLLTIVAYSWFTSTLTADTVKKVDNLPFSTFPDLSKQYDYSWGFGDSFFMARFLNSSSNSVIVTLRQRAVKYQHFIQKVDATSLQSLPDKFVFITYRSIINIWLSKVPNPKDYTVMENCLVERHNGLTFPVSSEINTLTTPHIIGLHDTSLLKRWHTEWPLFNSTDDQRQTGWDVLEGPILAFGSLLSISLVFLGFLLLIGECLVSRLQRQPVTAEDD